jgi:protein O-GlcNAc transferase
MEGGAATDRARRPGARENSAITTLPPAVSALLIGLGIAQAFRQAAIHQDQGRLDEAERLYRRILARQPDHAASLCRLGQIRMRQGRLDAAIALLRRAAGLINSADIQAGLGAVLAAIGRPAEAIAHYRQALAIDPDLAETHSNLGILLAARDGPEAALPHYQRALALRPDLAEAHGNLGHALLALRRHSEALAHYRRALALKPEFAAAHDGLGTVLEALGRGEEAAAAFARSAALAPRRAAGGVTNGAALGGVPAWQVDAASPPPPIGSGP